MSQTEDRKIAIIVNPVSKNKIILLGEKYYFWVAEINENTSVLDEAGIIYSSFPIQGSDTPYTMIDTYMDTIIEHHPEWNELLMVNIFELQETKSIFSPCLPYKIVKSDYGMKILNKLSE